MKSFKLNVVKLGKGNCSQEGESSGGGGGGGCIGGGGGGGDGCVINNNQELLSLIPLQFLILILINTGI